MTYSDKVLKALSLAETADDINLIRSKITSSESINRRTNEGRQLTEELLWQCTKKLNDMMEGGLEPF